MDALELGNDSGPAEIDSILPKQEGAYVDLGLDQQGLETALDSKEDSHRGRERREIEQSFSHPPPCLIHWHGGLCFGL